MVESLDSIASTNESLAESIAVMSLNALDELAARATNLNAAQKKRLAISRAGALAAIPSKSKEAAKEFARLCAAYRTDGNLQRDYGRWLSRQSGGEFQELALNQWRKIAAASRPKSDSWYEARYEVAATLIKQGKRSEAQQRIKYLKATSGFGPDPWPERFEALLK